jgi:hypothetical protein
MTIDFRRRCELSVSAAMVAHYALLTWKSMCKISLPMHEQDLPRNASEEVFYHNALLQNFGRQAPFLRFYDVRCSTHGIQLRIANHLVAHLN